MARIAVLCVERANFRAVEPAMRSLQNSGHEVRFFKGFDYKELTGEVPRFMPPPEFETVDPFVGEMSVSAGCRDVAVPWTSDIRQHLQARAAAASDTGGRLLRHCLAQEYWDAIVPATTHLATSVARFLDDFRPHVAVISEDTHYGQGALVLSTMAPRRIPTVAVLPPYYNLMAKTPRLGAGAADHYCVSTAVMREQLVRRGVPPSAVSLCRDAECLSLGAAAEPDRADTVTAALQHSSWEEILVCDLVSIFGALPESTLLLKTHPAHSTHAGEKLVTLPSNVHWVRRGAVTDLLERGSALVTMSSTAILAALWLERPLIVVQYSVTPADVLLLPGLLESLRVSSKRGLQDAVERVGQGRWPRIAREEVFGSEAERVTPSEIILRIAQGRCRMEQ